MGTYPNSIHELIKQLELETRIEKGHDLKKVIRNLQINKYISFWIIFIVEFSILLFVYISMPRLLYKTGFADLNKKQLLVVAFIFTTMFMLTIGSFKKHIDKLLLKQVIKRVSYLNKKWEEKQRKW